MPSLKSPEQEPDFSTLALEICRPVGHRQLGLANAGDEDPVEDQRSARPDQEQSAEPVNVGRQAIKPSGDRAPEERRTHRHSQNDTAHPQCIAVELPK